MNFDSRQVLILLTQWLIGCLILAWEQSFAIPFLFFIFSLVCIRLQPRYYREGLLLLWGISLAGLYTMWFGVGILWLFSLMVISYAISYFLPALRIRIILASLLGSLVLAQLMGLEMTLSKIIIMGLSLAIFWIVSIFVRWDVRHVPISKANWGWQSL